MRRDVYLSLVGRRSKCAEAGVALSLPLLLAGLLSLAEACGGSENAGKSAQSAHEVSQSNGDGSASEPEAASASEAPPEEEAPQTSPCADGTCSACGSGVCPLGWYCDESATGGPACGWLPQCAQKNSCGCLTGKLGASCKCSEQAGSLRVSCK